MIDITLTINGVDFKFLVSKYEVTHEVEARDMITTMDGTEHVASFRRPTVSFSLIPLSDAQSAEVYAVLSAIQLDVIYTDPYLGGDITTRMRVASNLNSAFGLRSVNGNRYYKGETIILRQRTAM